MAKRPYRTPDYCPIEITARVLSGKWKPVILFELQKGVRRHSMLQARLPRVSQRMLTLHLRELERDGLVVRCVADGPTCVEYSISARGRTLLPVLEAMNAWGAVYESRERCADRDEPVEVGAHLEASPR